MKPAEIFDIVLERVREYQAMEGRILAIRCDASARGGKPAVGNVMAEYCADFYRCGERVLVAKPGMWFDIFLLYFVDDGNCNDVMEILKLRPGTFWVTVARIRNQVGPELRRAGLFPPRLYRLNWRALENAETFE